MWEQDVEMYGRCSCKRSPESVFRGDHHFNSSSSGVTAPAAASSDSTQQSRRCQENECTLSSHGQGRRQVEWQSKGPWTEWQVGRTCYARGRRGHLVAADRRASPKFNRHVQCLFVRHVDSSSIFESNPITVFVVSCFWAQEIRVM